MTVEELKVQLLLAAYTGAVAVCEPLITNPDGTAVQIDPLIQDVGLKQKDLLVYEVAKVHYHALLRAYHDKTGVWPDPQLNPEPTPAPKPPTPAAALPGAELAAGIVHAAESLASGTH